MVHCFCAYYSSDVSLLMYRSFCVLYLCCLCWYSNKLDFDLIWFVKSTSSLVWAWGTRVCAYCLNIINKSTILYFEESWEYFLNKLRYFAWLVMSNDWDSLLQDVEIRYSKLTGIDGLLFIDMANNDDVMTWRRFPHYWPFVRGIYRSIVVDSPHKGTSNTGLWCCFDVCLNMILS